MPTTNSRVPLLLALVALLAAVTAAHADASGPASAAPAVSITVHGNGLAIAGPTRWRPGPIRITASSRSGEQEFTLLRFHPGYDYARFLADGARANGHDAGAAQAMRRVFANTDFLGGANVFPGAAASFTAVLHPGTYYLGEMSARPRFRRIVVAGASRAAAPASGAVVAAYDFGFHGDLQALPAKGTITIRNTGRQIHRVLFVPVAPGTTRAEVGAYLRKTGAAPYGPRPPFGRRGPQLGTAMISPGEEMQLTYSLPAGEYAVLCNQPDTRTGVPQELEGMYTVATLR